MLHLALPPAPPPIVITLPPQPAKGFSISANQKKLNRRIPGSLLVSNATVTTKSTNSSQPLLVGVIINNKEVGSLDIIQDGNSFLLPLEPFAEIADFTIDTQGETTELNTPLGKIKLSTNILKQIDGSTYISDSIIKEKLAAKIEYKSEDLALIVDLPWRFGSGQTRSQAAQLKPEFIPPSTGLSSVRQELDIVSSSGDRSLRSSTLLGGRLAGGVWRVRFNNNFVNQLDISEYFFFKRSGQFRYQVGRQQVGLHPLVNGVNLTGAQVAYTNLPADRFAQSYSASELLPRRSRPIQTFEGEAPPASFVQLRVGGIVVARQQVGLDGKYEFVDVNLPAGQSNDIEVLIYDRNNLNVPIEIRSLNLNASDLLLPAGGNIQLAGVGFSGNLVQNTLFDNDNSNDGGKPVAFYQLRQGITDNLTLEGTVQTLPDTVQAQAGLIWRLANPAILAASVGTSHGQLGYTADLDLELDRLQVIGNSQLFPAGYISSKQERDRFNHSLEVKYKFSNNFNLGLIARSRQDDSNSTSYILPTFFYRPFSGLSLNGRPNIQGQYLFNAYYQPNQSTRLSFNTFGNTYSTDLSYQLSRQYQLSLGSEFGSDLASRYSVTLNRSARTSSGLSWRLGLAYSDGDVGVLAGANMQVLPGLLARVEYQGIPSRSESAFGGFGSDRLTISLVSDFSFGGGRFTPANSTSLGQDRGTISGRLIVQGTKQKFDLSGANIRVVDNRNHSVGGAKTDAQGNFFVGSLAEGVYVVEIDPEGLPLELTPAKTTVVAEVAGAAITRLDFPVKAEFGLAGRVTDAAGKPLAEVEVELINADDKLVSTAMTDQFGLYRLDGVPVGKYTLRVPTFASTRQVEIRDNFLFDQDLQLK